MKRKEATRNERITKETKGGLEVHLTGLIVDVLRIRSIEIMGIFPSVKDISCQEKL